MLDSLATYIPTDRRHALAHGQALPDRTTGAALLADIVGFTRLTDVMTHLWGARRGAEEVSRQLNLVYDSLIAEVNRYGGTVISFAGDAIICWFDEAQGAAAARAVTCALAMQAAMVGFTAVSLPDGRQLPLAMTVNITSGPARRLLVGDPQIQRLDTLVGDTITRLEAAKQLTQGGELLVDEATAAHLDRRLTIQAWRHHEKSGERLALVTDLQPGATAVPWPPLPPNALTLAQVRPWLLTPVYEREQSGAGQFLTELRPVVALFLRFTGLVQDKEPDTAGRLNRFICAVQKLLTECGGTLLQLNIGDKGSYLYAAFGAPIAHEDDSKRAATAALALHTLAGQLNLPPLQIGISRGLMRAGSYGSASRRTYGVLGDDVNLAARLMAQAAPGETVVSARIQNRLAAEFTFVPLTQITLPGTNHLVPLFSLAGKRPPIIHLQEPTYTTPMIGRRAELALIGQKIELALQGAGQIVGISGEAGIGKSRLVAEIIRLAAGHNLRGYGGECQAYGANTPYLVWQPVWQSFFRVSPTAPPEQQVAGITITVERLAPQRLPALPLLKKALGLSVPDTAFTAALDPQARKSVLEALFIDCLRAAAQEARQSGQALLLVLEDLQWIDPVSYDLLESIALLLADWPLLLLLAYRPPDVVPLPGRRMTALPNFTPVPLTELPPPEAEQLVTAKMAGWSTETAVSLTPALSQQISRRAEGNPFYIEELINYLHNLDHQGQAISRLDELELPPSLHSLILSRIDQLHERQKITLKVASIIGRLFRFSWLHGYYPNLGRPEVIKGDLSQLAKLDLTPIERPEPELTYMFKHIVTQEVTYESLTYAARAALHEQLAAYIESLDSDVYLDLLAYHYAQSDNLAKKRHYLQRAGEAAAARFANAEALDYFSRTLALVSPTEIESLYELHLKREHLYDLVGERPAQQAELASLVQLAQTLADAPKQAQVALRQARCAENMGDYNSSIAAVEQVIALARQTGDTICEAEGYLQWGRVLIRQGLYDSALIQLNQALSKASGSDDDQLPADCLRNLGTVAWAQGDYIQAQTYYEQSLALNQAAANQRGESALLNNLGVVALSQSDYETAKSYYLAAWQSLRQIGDRPTEAVVMGNLGLVVRLQGDYDEARRYQEQSLRLRQEIGDSFGESVAKLQLGTIALDLGDYEQAEQLLQEVRDYYQEAGNRLGEVSVLIYLGLLHCWQGDYQAAAQFSQQAIGMAQAAGSRSEEAMALNHLGHAWLGLGRLAEATAVYQQALTLFTEIGQPNYAQEARAGLAQAAWRQGDLATATAQVQAVLTHLEQHNLDGTYDPIQVYLACYDVLQATADPQARSVLAEAARLLHQRAATIADPARRRTFLEAVPSNRRLQMAVDGTQQPF